MGGHSSIRPALAFRLAEHRLATHTLLRGLPPEAWTRTGVHEEAGSMTLKQMAERVVNHELEHLEHLRRLKGAAMAAVP